jgi:hypothetical protein
MESAQFVQFADFYLRRLVKNEVDVYQVLGLNMGFASAHPPGAAAFRH